MTFFNGFESIVVAQASAIDELRARFAIRVIVINWEVSTAWAFDLRQQTRIFSGWSFARRFAVFDRIETIVVATAAAVPESRATAIFQIEEVFDCVIAASASILEESTRFLWHNRNLFAAIELWSLSVGDAIWTTAVFACGARASFEIGSSCGRNAIGTAFVFALQAMAAVGVWALGNRDAIGTATELIVFASASFEFRSLRRRDFVWTAAVWLLFTTAALFVVAASRCLIVWAAAVRRIFTAAIFEIWSASWIYVIWTTAIRRFQATSFAVRTVSRCNAIATTAKWFTIAWGAEGLVLASRTLWWCSRSVDI